jgi:lantibiotic modifying enzyme
MGVVDDVYLEVARDALRWVAGAAVPAEGGVRWPWDLTPGARLADDVYDGTAGVLISLCEARASGLTEFDDVAAQAAGRLRWVTAHAARWAADKAAADPDGESEWTGLYGGIAGHATALRMWAQVGGDSDAATEAMERLAEIGLGGRANRYNDIITGEAGMLVVLADASDLDQAAAAAAAIADRLVGEAVWEHGEPDWDICAGDPYRMPGFSHGAAGIGFALARAGSALDRPDLIDVAVLAANRLVRLGTRPDGTLLVPNRGAATPPDDPVSYGWCHGPTGTLRLFALLEQLRPGQGWAASVQACRRAVRASGLPARLFPGFWDNLGQCCGTAGVAEMAVDAYQESSDPEWLAWADTLAEDILSRRVSDDAGVRWSNTEFRVDPAELPPVVGWMQGAAGIAGFLARLARVHADGPAARQLAWPDQVVIGAPAA